MAIQTIGGEPIRYPLRAGEPLKFSRWFYNNGFRRHYLRNGYRIVRSTHGDGRPVALVMCRFNDGEEYPAWAVNLPRADSLPPA